MSGKITKSKKLSFTAVPNDALHNKELSWKSKGLLCYLLSLSDDWVVYKKDLKNRSTDGYDSTVTAFKELEDFGYISSVSVRDGGLFSGVDYFIHEFPIHAPTRDIPESEKPDTENPRLLNNSLKEIKDIRAKAFKKSLVPYLISEQNPKGYESKILKDFYDYWTETSDERKTFRFESEPYFDLSKRLARFRTKDTERQSKGYSYYQGEEVGN